MDNVGTLFVWCTVRSDELLGGTYGMEVSGVLGKHIKCCLAIDNGIEALGHVDSRRRTVGVLVWFVFHSTPLLCFSIARLRWMSIGVVL